MQNFSDVLSDRAVLQFCKHILLCDCGAMTFCSVLLLCLQQEIESELLTPSTHQTTDFSVCCALCHYNHAGVSLQLVLAFAAHTVFRHASDLLTTHITA